MLKLIRMVALIGALVVVAGPPALAGPEKNSFEHVHALAMEAKDAKAVVFSTRLSKERERLQHLFKSY